MQDSVWKLGGLSAGTLGKRVWNEVSADDVLNRAAALAYYFLLALFPALLFLVTLLGFFADPSSHLRGDMLNYLAVVMPPSALDLVSKTLDEIATNAGGGKLSLGLFLAFWAASSGMLAIMDSLNAAYAVRETRPWYKQRAIAVALTLAISVLVVGSLLLVLFGGHIADNVAASMGGFGLVTALWSVFRWVFVAFGVSFAFALTYYFGPSVKDQRWYWVTPGSLVGLVLWLGISLAFRVYLSYFNTYAASYGSLGALIILMLWFYLSGLAILVGGEVNAEIESAAARAGDVTAKGKGAKKPGELPPIQPYVNTCVNRPAPSVRELIGSFKALVAAVKRFIAVLKEGEHRPA